MTRPSSSPDRSPEPMKCGRPIWEGICVRELNHAGECNPLSASQTPERPMSRSIEELLGRFQREVRVYALNYGHKGEGDSREFDAARSAIESHVRELEAENARREEALEMFRDEQSRDKARIADINDRIMQDTRDLEHHVAEIWRLRSRIAELEAELVEERKIGMRLTPGKLPEEKWDY